MFDHDNSDYLNHFTQPDSIVPNPSNPQDWDRYSYARNNPLKYTDSSGHRPCGDGEAIDCDGKPHDPKIVKSDSSDSGGGTDGGDCYIGDNIRCGRYFSVALGLDVPTIIMLGGIGVSVVGLPEIGIPLALFGVGLEGSFVKLISLNVSAIIDENGNLYVGPQASFGKSILPAIAFSDNLGGVVSDDRNPPTESEMIDSISGLYLSGGTIATGGISYSPGAKANKISYYLVGIPEIASANFGYNFHVYDFSP